MNILFMVMRLFVSICVGFSILVFGGYLFKKMSSKSSFNDFKELLCSKRYLGSFSHIASIILIIGFVFTIFLNGAFQQKIGLYNIYLLDEGTYCFNVEIVSAINNEEIEGNIYPAEIHIEKATEEAGYYDEKTLHKRLIFLENVYMGNKVLDCYGENVHINDEIIIYDNKDNEYTIKLLNQHSYSKKVTETNNATAFDIVFLFLEISTMLFCICSLFNPNNKNNY